MSGSGRAVGGSGPDIAYIIGTYPVPTTTFIDREIEALRRKGAHVRIVSIRIPYRALSPEQEALREGVHYVMPVRPGALGRSHAGFLFSRPAIYLGTLLHLLTRPHPSARARIRTFLHFGLGVHVARLIRDRCPCDHIHAHFVDRAAVVAMVAGRLLDRPYSATAHANDIYEAPVLLPEKIAQAKFVVTCTRFNESHLRAVSGPRVARAVRCVYHGLDTRDYVPGDRSERRRPLLLAVGQLKEKKGLRHLVDACAILASDGVAFDCEIVGEGPLRDVLQAQIDELGLGERVSLLGALTHRAVVERYREASVFVLPCVTASSGDRDGIPNVILEAMAMQLPVVSTRHSGIPEAVGDGQTGLLVDPADAVALAEALARLLADTDLGERFGREGRRRVVELFDVDRNAQRLLEEFVA